MNRVFKTRWSIARQQYVVTDEHHTTKDRRKTLIAATVAAVLGGGVAQAAYVDPGFVAQTHEDVAKATASWETAEYLDDWGLKAMNASSAYALGYNGAGIAVGVMDSGALLYKHSDLDGDRFHAVKVDNQSYGSSGNRYPQHTTDDGVYTPDSEVPVSGEWQMGMNDSHGTHVTGTVGGNRDGNVFHGVAWGSDVYVGNTGGTDDTNYGPFQDPQFFYQGWNAIAKELSAANKFSDGTTRGGFINNSFGTNTRVVNNGSYGPDGGNTGVHFPTDTVSQTEYEYFLFTKDAENRVNVDSRWDGKSFVDAAYEAVKDEKVVQIFTTGNRDFANPFYRPLYPYFNPEAEQNWIAVSGLTKDGDDKYKLWGTVNEAGNAKWWTVVAPGTNISSSIVNGDGTPGYSNTYSGTSMAAPHVAGAMAVLMQRYDQMDALQVRDVMLTTATHYNPDGSIMTGWNNTDGTTPLDGQVSDRMGWGLPDLEKGMYGPGQFLGKFTYNMRDKDSLDVWSNDISQVALDQRKAEDMAWKAAAEKWYDAGKPLKLDDTFNAEEKKLIGDILLDTSDDIVGIDEAGEKIDEADAIAWRDAYFQKRLKAIAEREYDGSLVKQGEGTLVMLGSNTYRGGTTVEGGTLLGLTESFGEEDVVVNGGNFGVIGSYDDTFTKTGSYTASEERKANVVVNAGGTYLVSAGEDVNVGKLELKEGAGISVWTGESSDLLSMWNDGAKLQGSVKADNLTGTTAVGDSHLAFFQTDVVTEGNKITATMQKREGGMAAAATTYNGRGIGAAVESAPESKVFEEFIGATKDQAARTFDSLGSDINFAAQNLAVVNSLTLTRAVKDQAMGYGTANTAKLDNGVELWATGIGAWSNADAGGASTDLDADFYAGLIGGELQVCSATKLGVFFGAGTTDFKGGNDGDIDSDDIHAGIYGETNVGSIAASYGFTYTWQDRELKRGLVFMDTVGMNTTSYDADIMQLFGEVAYTGLNTDTYSVEPYFGFSWIHAKADGFSETVGGHTMASNFDNQNIEVTHLGVRGAMPFKLASVDMKVKGDVNWMHFFGDTEAEGTMRIGDAGVASLKGEELDNLFGVGLGIEAKAGESTTFGLSYTGAYGSDVTSHGIGVNVRYAF